MASYQPPVLCLTFSEETIMNKFKAVSEMLKLSACFEGVNWKITHPVSGNTASISKVSDGKSFRYMSWNSDYMIQDADCHNTFMGAIGFLAEWFIAQFRIVTRETLVGKVFTVGQKSYKVVSFNDLETCVISEFSPFGSGVGKSYHQNIDSLIKAFRLGTAEIQYEYCSI
ncbi:hypothetical protein SERRATIANATOR_14 [Serratia phage vB_SmaS_Serratianator]|nr:hypothetical protein SERRATIANATOR_14 [Serratia phage vB_SmaS_Serratianator]